MPLVFIIFIVLLLITVIIIVVNNAKSKSHLTSACTSDDDCPDSDLCIPNPEEQGEKQCFPADKTFCKVQPVTDLQECLCPSVDENGVCQGSTDCDKCLNNPKFSCIQVSDKNPYKWKQGKTEIQVPNSERGHGWCLPNIQNRDITCNPYTSDYVLHEIGPGQYEWGCLCKYPNLFDNAQGPLSNCTLPRACGTVTGTTTLGKLYVPNKKECHSNSDCGGNDVCLDVFTPSPCGYDDISKHIETNDCKNSDSCVCHTPWEGSITEDTDPLTGQCVCEDNLEYQCVVRSSDYFEMNCVKGFCSSVEGAREADSSTCNASQCYKQDGDCMCCKCPPGYIRCPDDINSNNSGLVTYCTKAGPTCIRDPCSTKEVPGGYWDPEKNSCVCPGENFVSMSDENSAVGQVCKDACQGNGPCGNRGTCYFPEGGKTVEDALCCNCHCPYTNEGDDSCTCSATLKSTKGAIRQANGGECCSDGDCCSGNCKDADCGGTDRGSGYGLCVGDIKPNSSCDDKKCTIKPPSPPVTCPDSTMCPYQTTCCESKDGTYNCCPYENGSCCGDGIHCCPSSHPVCDVANKTCTTKDGKSKVPWASNK